MTRNQQINPDEMTPEEEFVASVREEFEPKEVTITLPNWKTLLKKTLPFAGLTAIGVLVGVKVGSDRAKSQKERGYIYELDPTSYDETQEDETQIDETQASIDAIL